MSQCNAIAQANSTTARRRVRRQDGFLTFSGVLLILVVAVIIFTAFKLLPPYIDNYRLQDSLENISRNATYNKTSDGEIRALVKEEAQQLGILLEDNQIQVQRAGVSVNIAVHYSVPVDLLVRQVDLTFQPFAGNRNIMARP